MRALLDHVDVNGDAIDGRAAVFGWMSEQMALRHAGSDKPIVCIMDGEEALWGMRDAFQEDVPMIDILDLLHVTPRLWDAATLFHPKGSRAAENFVRERVMRILYGEVDGVVRGLRRMGTTQKLRGPKATKRVRTAAPSDAGRRGAGRGYRRSRAASRRRAAWNCLRSALSRRSSTRYSRIASGWLCFQTSGSRRS